MGTLNTTVADNILNAIARGVAFAGFAEVWVKLHIGAPGAAGTANPAANTTRKQATFGDAAADRLISNTAIVSWVGVPEDEEYSHVSFWDDEVAGNNIGADDLDPSTAVEAGGTFRIPIGQLTLTVT